MVAIRRALRSDLGDLRDLWVEFEQFLNTIADPVPVDTSRFAAVEQLAFGPTPLCTILLAEMIDRPVGYLVYHLGVWMDDLAPALFVADLFVREGSRGKGAGGKLMEAARDIACDAGAEHVYWTVWERNLAAREFYARLGADDYSEERMMRWNVRSRTPR